MGEGCAARRRMCGGPAGMWWVRGRQWVRGGGEEHGERRAPAAVLHRRRHLSTGIWRRSCVPCRRVAGMPAADVRCRSPARLPLLLQGQLPQQPLVVRAKFVSKLAERKIKEVGGAVQLVA